MDIGQLAATSGRSLTGALTVAGTLAFVAACFVVVELVDRRPRPASPQPRTATPSPSHDLGVDGPMADLSVGDDPYGFRHGRWTVPLHRALTVSYLGVVAAGLLGGALVPARSTVGQAGIALSLVLVVVAAAAFGGRIAAAITSAGAALTFNLLHTEPYLTFHIDRSPDVITSVLMIVVGIAVGEVAQRSLGQPSPGGTTPPEPGPPEQGSTHERTS